MAENVGGEAGKLALSQGNCRHWVFRQHDMRHDRSGTLPFFVGDLVKAPNVSTGLLQFTAADKMTIGTKASC